MSAFEGSRWQDGQRSESYKDGQRLQAKVADFQLRQKAMEEEAEALQREVQAALQASRVRKRTTDADRKGHRMLLVAFNSLTSSLRNWPW